MHEILSKLKIRTIQFLVKFLLENRSRVKILSKLTFFSSKILSKLKIRIIFASNSISLQILSLFKISCICRHVYLTSSKTFLSYLRIPLVCYFINSDCKKEFDGDFSPSDVLFIKYKIIDRQTHH